MAGRHAPGRWSLLPRHRHHLVARRRTASLVLLAGVTIECSSQALSRPILALAVIVTSNPSVLAAVLLPIVFPLLMGVAAWSGSLRDSDLLQA